MCLKVLFAICLTLCSGLACSPSPKPSSPGVPKPAISSAYPIAVDINKVGTYPGFTKSGAGYFYDEVLEYRVWMYPLEGGDDYHKAFPTYEEALAYSKKNLGAEEPLVLILQREWINEPQPGNYVRMNEERITEWKVEWLAGSKRSQEAIDRFLAEHQRPNVLRISVVRGASEATDGGGSRHTILCWTKPS
jgi:putative acetyltransferase